MKTDRRISKTKKAVFAAFEKLLTEKRYEKLTIQEIIDGADIGRTTFYAHFQTKDDLLGEMCAELFDHIFSDDLAQEVTHDFSGKKEDVHTEIRHILYHLRDDQIRLKRIFTCESSELFWAYFRKPFEQMIRTHMAGEISSETVPEDFMLRHITSSFIETVKWWFEDGLKEAPETVAGYYETVIGRTAGN